MPKFEKGNQAAKGHKSAKSVPLVRDNGDLRAFLARVVTGAAYRKRLRQRLESGTLAPTIEAAVLAYVLGKPPADAPELPTPPAIPGDPLAALALKLIRLDGENFRLALEALFLQSTSAPEPDPHALPPHEEIPHDDH
jgi:hypothetical protein